LTVFDQEEDSWFRWTGEGWEPDSDTRITQIGITGGGSRVLTDNGLSAINELFDRSFG